MLSHQYISQEYNAVAHLSFKQEIDYQIRRSKPNSHVKTTSSLRTYGDWERLAIMRDTYTQFFKH